MRWENINITNSIYYRMLKLYLAQDFDQLVQLQKQTYDRTIFGDFQQFTTDNELLFKTILANDDIMPTLIGKNYSFYIQGVNVNKNELIKTLLEHDTLTADTWYQFRLDSTVFTKNRIKQNCDTKSDLHQEIITIIQNDPTITETEQIKQNIEDTYSTDVETPIEETKIYKNFQSQTNRLQNILTGSVEY